MKRGKPMKRKKPMSKWGKVTKLRAVGNWGAKRHFFVLKGWSHCQVCGHPIERGYAQAHHKAQRGEELENKLICHAACHLFFVHDANHRDRRQTAKDDSANCRNGLIVRWTDEQRADLEHFIGKPVLDRNGILS